jgi:hypothetical protein
LLAETYLFYALVGKNLLQKIASDDRIEAASIGGLFLKLDLHSHPLPDPRGRVDFQVGAGRRPLGRPFPFGLLRSPRVRPTCLAISAATGVRKSLVG